MAVSWLPTDGARASTEARAGHRAARQEQRAGQEIAHLHFLPIMSWTSFSSVSMRCIISLASASPLEVPFLSSFMATAMRFHSTMTNPGTKARMHLLAQSCTQEASGAAEVDRARDKAGPCRACTERHSEGGLGQNATSHVRKPCAKNRATWLQ